MTKNKVRDYHVHDYESFSIPTICCLLFMYVLFIVFNFGCLFSLSKKLPQTSPKLPKTYRTTARTFPKSSKKPNNFQKTSKIFLKHFQSPPTKKPYSSAEPYAEVGTTVLIDKLTNILCSPQPLCVDQGVQLHSVFRFVFRFVSQICVSCYKFVCMEFKTKRKTYTLCV